MILTIFVYFWITYEALRDDEDENGDVNDIGIARVYTDELELAGYHLTPTQKPFYNVSDFKRLYFFIVPPIILVSFIITNLKKKSKKILFSFSVRIF